MALSAMNSVGQSADGNFGINGIEQKALKLANINIFLFFFLIREHRLMCWGTNKRENALIQEKQIGQH